MQPNPGHVWVPGWFDGESWQAGEWVAESRYRAEDPDAWTPEEGWDDAPEPGGPEPVSEEAPLAIPVPIAG